MRPSPNGAARPAPHRQGRLRALLLSAFTLGAAPILADAGEITTIRAPSGPWIVETIHRAHAPHETPLLIVGLHGYGIDQRQMATLVNVRPDLPNIYVALRGRYPAPEGGYGWFAVGLDGDRIVFDPAELTRIGDTVADLLPHLADRFGADPARIHLVGYSQGATLALHIALSRPDAAASVTGFAGALLPAGGDPAPSPSGPTPVLIGHGTRDPLISADDIAATRARLERAGRVVELVTHPVPHVVSRAGRADIETWIERQDGVAPSRRRPDIPPSDTLATKDIGPTP